MQSVLSADHFHNEKAAYAFVEARLWPEGSVCPHCGATKERVGRLRGKTNRIGLYKCYACRKPFTVKIGTVFESSHIPMRVWLQAIYLFCSSKKGISTRQLQRTFRCGLKTAWFLGHRVREAMRDLGIPDAGPLGGENQVVEADETFVGGKAANRAYKPPPKKAIVLSLVLAIEQQLAKVFEMQRARLSGQDPRAFFAIGAKRVSKVQGAIANNGTPVLSLELESGVRLDFSLDHGKVRDLIEWLEELEAAGSKPRSRPS